MEESLLNEGLSAIVAEDLTAVRAFFERNPGLITESGRWLHQACSLYSLEVVALLIELGANTNQPSGTSTNELPLDAALGQGIVDVVELLLKSGASPDPDRQILIAAGNDLSALEMVQLLEAYGADIYKEFDNEFTGENMNALSQAEDYGNDDVVEYLKKKGVKSP